MSYGQGPRRDSSLGGGAAPKPGTIRANAQRVDRGQPVAPVSQPGAEAAPRKKRDPDKAPNGYDQRYWDLAKYFAQTCDAHGEDSKPVPIVYMEIMKRAQQQHLESGEDVIERDLTKARPADNRILVGERTVQTRHGEVTKPVYKIRPLPADWNATVRMRDIYQDENGKPLAWWEVGFAMIDRFWTDKAVIAEHGGDALTDFCRLTVFEHLHLMTCRKWESARHRKWYDAQLARKWLDPNYGQGRGHNRRRIREEQMAIGRHGTETFRLDADGR